MRVKFLSFTVFCASALACAAHAADGPRNPEMDEFIDGLMAKMTLEEKVGQMNLLTWDGSLQTGVEKSKGVSEKIARGVVG